MGPVFCKCRGGRDVTLAEAADRLGVVPDFIKVDIKGYEALRGSADFLRQHAPTILLEPRHIYLEQRRLSARTLVETLRGCGYVFRSSWATR